MKEIYIIIKDKAHTLKRIEGLCSKYHTKTAINEQQRKRHFKSYCHDAVTVINDCFETSLLGAKRTINKINEYSKKDNVNIQAASLDIFNILINLKCLVESSVPIQDLPSCRRLIGLSPEDAVFKANEFVKNNDIRAGIHILSLESNVTDTQYIEAVTTFYSNYLHELKDEINFKRIAPNQIEQFLLDKFNIELEYCRLAQLKAGNNIAKDIKGLADIAKESIEKREQRLIALNKTLLSI
ncbi:MAG: hypothetical protein IKW97_09950 [Muribaculaceae bacterium]|nr:hypothetical protein [Muribaculaceae bacterium]